MGRPLREALRRLCVDFGWSYAVFWRATGLESRVHLIWEDGYCDPKPEVSRLKPSNFLPKEQVAKTTVNDCSELICQADEGIRVLVDKVMASQVHVVGDGLIGQAASVEKYQWLNNDSLDIFGSTSKGFAEMKCQIEAGIQTTVIVPMLPTGVIQLGSTKMIMENIAFINHVKSLFLKLNDGSGALPSDTIQKASRDKCQTYSLNGPSFACQSTDVRATIDKKLPVAGNESILERVESSAPRCFAESFSAVSPQLNKRIQPSASEVMLSKHRVTMTYPLGKYILQGAEDNFPKPDLECSQQVPSGDSISKCQNELSILNSVLLSNSLKVLEEQLMFTSSVGALESTNNLSSSNNAAEIGNAGLTSRSCGGTECSISSAKLSVIDEPPILYQRSHPLQNPCIMDVSKKDQSFSANKVLQSLSQAGAVKQKDYLIQTSCTFSSKPEVRVSCSDILPGIFQEYGLCDSKPVQTDNGCKEIEYVANDACPAEYKQCMQDLKERKLVHVLKNDMPPIPLDFCSSNDLFGMLGFDHKTYWSNGSLDDVLGRTKDTNSCNLSTDMPKLPAESVTCRVSDSLNDQVSCSRLFSVEDSDQLLDAVISNIHSSAKHRPDGVSCDSKFTDICSSCNAGTSNQGDVHLSKHMNDEFVDFSPEPAKTEPSCLSYGKSSCSFEKDGEYIHKAGLHKSQISSWVESCQSAKNDCVSDSNSKKGSDFGKLNRKRPRPGESPRPRPKDRQMIQDRIKELREIVPNGAKCSIDTLLEKTIKHMLFLQSVTKHADELKVGGEPKIRNEEGGLLLKDNFEGGATWAFEVGTEPMICPIVVEDLNPPRQMLVEMLCEERGSFLEIADFIRGLGLTILKGVMEARRSKIWARFAVEANRDVTRMEIFLSLVQLLEPTAGSSVALPNVGNISMLNTMFQQSSVPARVI